MTNQIRNIVQSHQEREIVKTAPDMVVYYNGLPWVRNPYLGKTSSGVAVNINDYISSISISYGVDRFIPNGNITLSVPAHFRYLFMAPGGNKILNTMAEIQIFAKGYFFTKDGKSIYYRVFHGLVQNIGYTDVGTGLEISIAIVGVLRLMEIMQINMAPSLLNHGGTDATAYIDRFASMEPLSRISSMFAFALNVDTFLRTGIDETKIKGSPDNDAIEMGFINQWQDKLTALSEMTFIYGLAEKDSYSALAKLQKDTEKSTQIDKQKHSAQAVKDTRSEKKSLGEVFLEEVQKYLPGMGVGNIDLTNSKITSRLEQIRIMLNAVLYEGYQDIDGKIIMKPPLYNLDVCNLKSTGMPYDPGYTNETNPFVIYSAEIESENMDEDETRIVATRMTLQGNFCPGVQLDVSPVLKGVASYINVALLARFGIREFAPRTISFISDRAEALYALAAAELNKANRGYSTYTCTIPLRPEMKLGFPIYLPHQDMYAYPETITINYTVGGKASMTLSCDSLRKRPMVGAQVTTGGVKGKVYNSAPNLVYGWVPLSEVRANLDASNPSGQPAMLPAVDAMPTEVKYLESLRSGLGNRAATNSADTQNAWVIMPGGGKSNPNDPLPPAPGTWSGGYSKDNGWKGIINKENFALVKNESGVGYRVDRNYIMATTCCQPYTDDKGYELIGPFPWGRWIPLQQAVVEFTTRYYVRGSSGSSTANVSSSRTIPSAMSMLTMGVSTPVKGSGGLVDSRTGLSTSGSLQDIQNKVSSGLDSPYVTSFVLSYADPVAQVTNTNQNANATTKDINFSTTVCLNAGSDGFFDPSTSKIQNFSRNYALGSISTESNPLATNSVSSSTPNPNNPDWLNSFTAAAQGSGDWASTMQKSINNFGATSTKPSTSS